MAGFKNDRRAQDIRMALQKIFTELKDPRVSDMLSVLKIDLSNDLSYCKVYVSAIEGVEKTEDSVKGLKSAAGFIRREIAHRLNLRKAPEFKFIADHSIDHSMHINDLLHQIAEKPAAQEVDESDEA